jgi:enterochelin esterase-like enzyme
MVRTRFAIVPLAILIGFAPAFLAAETPPVPIILDRWSTPPANPQPLLTHHTFRSPSMDADVGYNLYLPPGYDLPENKDVRYPVLYWLHGMNQSESTDQYPPQYLDDAIKAGTVKPMIVVYASGGKRTYYTDTPREKSYSETSIIKELIPHIDATYRTHATRDKRAIAGMSMGGFGALKFAFKYPDLFSSVTAFAPGIRDPESFAKDRPDILARRFGNDPAAYEANHPATLLKKNLDQIRGKLPVSLYVGTKDYLLPGARALHAQMTEAKVEHVYEEFDGVTHNLTQYSSHTKAAPFVFADKHFK